MKTKKTTITTGVTGYILLWALGNTSSNLASYFSSPRLHLVIAENVGDSKSSVRVPFAVVPENLRHLCPVKDNQLIKRTRRSPAVANDFIWHNKRKSFQRLTARFETLRREVVNSWHAHYCLSS
jgi:hypothetical protein